MKKLFVLLLIMALSASLIACGDQRQESPPQGENSSKNSETSNIEISQNMSNDNPEIIDEDPSAETYDFPNASAEEIIASYDTFIEEHSEEKPSKIDLIPLIEVFPITQIVPQDGYYNLGNADGHISVFDRDVVYDEKSLFELHIKNRDYISVDDIGVYNDYSELEIENFINKYPVLCLKYKKEGIDIYAIRSAALTMDYQINFAVGDIYFEVNTAAYKYPGDSDGVLRNKDNWFFELPDDTPANEALIELSDVTTESSALIRALKEAVGMNG